MVLEHSIFLKELQAPSFSADLLVNVGSSPTPRSNFSIIQLNGLWLSILFFIRGLRRVSAIASAISKSSRSAISGPFGKRSRSLATRPSKVSAPRKLNLMLFE